MSRLLAVELWWRIGQSCCHDVPPRRVPRAPTMAIPSRTNSAQRADYAKARHDNGAVVQTGALVGVRHPSNIATNHNVWLWQTDGATDRRLFGRLCAILGSWGGGGLNFDVGFPRAHSACDCTSVVSHVLGWLANLAGQLVYSKSIWQRPCSSGQARAAGLVCMMFMGAHALDLHALPPRSANGFKGEIFRLRFGRASPKGW